jgi:hypothetical protein
MNISGYRIERDAGWSYLTADVQTEQALEHLPGQLYFGVPEALESFLDPGPDPFLVALQQFAMSIGETLRLEGKLSAMLAHRSQDFRRIYAGWYPGAFQDIAVQADSVQPVPPLGEDRGVALTFSGGVDSMFSLAKENPVDQPLEHNRLSHAIFVFYGQNNHFWARYQKKAEAYQLLLDELGVQLIGLKTNVREFHPIRPDLDRGKFTGLTYGAGLAAFGLALGRGLRWLNIASGMSVFYEGVDGSKAITNNLLSTEQFTVAHHGLVESRGDKLRVLADWPVGYGHLNVCWLKVDGTKNCGRCPKCARTIAYLHALGVDSYSSEFMPAGWFARHRWFGRIREGKFTREIARIARANKRWGLYFWARTGLAVVWMRRLIRPLVQWNKPSYDPFNR